MQVKRSTVYPSSSWLAVLLLSLVAIGVGCDGSQGPPGIPGPPGPQGPPGDPGSGIADTGTSVETCVQCHNANGVLPVGDITAPSDAHHIDLDPDGPLTASGYRQLNIAVTSVDVSGSSVVIEFDVTDENGAAVVDLFASDGRFNMARLLPPPVPFDGHSAQWEQLIGGRRYERFETTGGVFQYLGGSSYRYTSVFDPSSAPVAVGDTIRVAIQLSASDLPPGQGWCDFDATLAGAESCNAPVSVTRDIVQTDTCNSCHGVTSDTQLRFHGSRTEVEYCVTCHNPGLAEFAFTPMIHKIHYGAQLANGFLEFSNVNFTKDIDNCQVCHTGGGADVNNWRQWPTREACGSCHDDVDFATGVNHGSGGVQTNDVFCQNCHPASGMVTPGQLPIDAVHMGDDRIAEGATYRGGTNGYSLDSVDYDPLTDELTIDFSVTRNGTKMLLESDPEWTAPAGASRLAVVLGWEAVEYTNEGSGNNPAQPVSLNALAVGSVVQALGGGDYRIVTPVPSGASGTITVGLEGHPAADIDGDGVYSDRIAVQNVYEHVLLDQRLAAVLTPRRDIVDVAKCNACHDSAGAGVSLHGNNRTSEDQVCVVCHNADATDVNRRPADPTMTADGKGEEAIDFKRMIHMIHMGEDLQNGIIVYGFGGSVHDFSHVGFIGNMANCETCHLPGTYSTEAAWMSLATTIDTGTDLADPEDDLNVSPVASVCSSCHDLDRSTQHMLLEGASFQALDENIR